MSRPALVATWRILAAFSALLLGFIASIVIAASLGTGPRTMVACYATQALGFAALRFSRTAESPARPLRLTVGVACVVALCMIYGLWWPVDPVGIQSLVALVVGSALAVAGAVLATRDRRLAFWLLLPLALWALVVLKRSGAWFVHAGGAKLLGPSTTYAFFIAFQMSMGWLVAMFHLLTMKTSEPREPGALATPEPEFVPTA